MKAIKQKRNLITIIILAAIFMIFSNDGNCTSTLITTQDKSNQKNTFSEIKAEITKYLQTEFEGKFQGELAINIKDIDKRIKLKSCSCSLIYSLANSNKIGQRTLVKVFCNDFHAWKLFVPVDLSVMENVCVANKPIAKGEIIKRDDIYMQKVNVLKLYGGYHIKEKNVIGKALKAAIRPGTIITSKLLTYPKIIKKGEIVSITYKSNFFNIKTKAKALKAGAINEKILLQNLKSDKTITGKVVAKGEVFVE